MQLDFFSLEDDIASILTYLLTGEGFTFFEGYSEIDEPIRQFKNIEQWRNARLSKGDCLLLRGWSEQFTNKPIFREIILDAKIGGKRTSVENAALVQIKEGRINNGALYPASISHWNEAGARQRSIWTSDQLDEIKWAELRRISGRMQRYIKKELALATLGSIPILPAAYSAFSNSEFDLWNFGAAISSGSILVELKP